MRNLRLQSRVQFISSNFCYKSSLVFEASLHTNLNFVLSREFLPKFALLQLYHLVPPLGILYTILHRSQDLWINAAALPVLLASSGKLHHFGSNCLSVISRKLK
jgi:hypothetical protein